MPISGLQLYRLGHFPYRGTSPTAVEVGVPKLGNCLEMYTCAQASV